MRMALCSVISFIVCSSTTVFVTLESRNSLNVINNPVSVHVRPNPSHATIPRCRQRDAGHTTAGEQIEKIDALARVCHYDVRICDVAAWMA